MMMMQEGSKDKLNQSQEIAAESSPINIQQNSAINNSMLIDGAKDYLSIVEVN